MEENKVTTKSTSESTHHHHHHHHHSGSKHKDATGEYRKRMFSHVERMRFIRKWGFNIMCAIAGLICFIVLLLYTLD